MKSIRFGIVGLGKQGLKYAKLINDNRDILYNSEIRAVCSRGLGKKDLVKSLFPNALYYTDYDEMLKSGEIDAVIITTPQNSHPYYAIKAFNHNIHVLTDKTAGITTKDVREMNNEALKHPTLHFGIIFNQRCNPLYLKAKEIIGSKGFGKVTHLNWIVTDWYRPDAYHKENSWSQAWNGGGGVLMNQAPHNLDLISFMLNKNPSEVNAKIKMVGRNISVENDVVAFMTYDDGMSAIFRTSCHDIPGTNRLEIDGEGGRIVIEDKTLTFTQTDILEPEFNKISTSPSERPKMSTVTFKCPDYYKNKRPTGEALKEYIKNPPEHLGIIKNYVEVLLGKAQDLIAPGIDGINSLELANAIYLSSWEQRIVTLPLDDEAYSLALNKKIENDYYQ
ncbi:MAG: Gfo/Idh/MocA family oxidoreductase [Acholeplasmatales bacterium]|nr:Gfo/Idh/MocA family oxidoreductase [Acholeplasmatales bacterium]